MLFQSTNVLQCDLYISPRPNFVCMYCNLLVVLEDWKFVLFQAMQTHTQFLARSIRMYIRVYCSKVTESNKLSSYMSKEKLNWICTHVFFHILRDSSVYFFWQNYQSCRKYYTSWRKLQKFNLILHCAIGKVESQSKRSGNHSIKNHDMIQIRSLKWFVTW